MTRRANYPDDESFVPTEGRGLTLLGLARAAAKEQWYSGEACWIWGNPQVGAYLKNVNGYIRLYTTQAGMPGLNVYMLKQDGWAEVSDLDRKYVQWVETIKEKEEIANSKILQKTRHAVS